MTDVVSMLSVVRWPPMKATLGVPVRPPRLVTPDEAARAIESTPDGSGAWLIALATLGAILTVAWWIWWGIRYHRARFDPQERTFRALARGVGLRPAERELVRQRAREVGRDPIEVLATAIDLPALFSGSGAVERRIRSAIGDTDAPLTGTP